MCCMYKVYSANRCGGCGFFNFVCVTIVLQHKIEIFGFGLSVCRQSGTFHQFGKILEKFWCISVSTGCIIESLISVYVIFSLFECIGFGSDSETSSIYLYFKHNECGDNGLKIIIIALIINLLSLIAGICFLVYAIKHNRVNVTLDLAVFQKDEELAKQLQHINAKIKVQQQEQRDRARERDDEEKDRESNDFDLPKPQRIEMDIDQDLDRRGTRSRPTNHKKKHTKNRKKSKGKENPRSKSKSKSKSKRKRQSDDQRNSKTNTSKKSQSKKRRSISPSWSKASISSQEIRPRVANIGQKQQDNINIDYNLDVDNNYGNIQSTSPIGGDARVPYGYNEPQRHYSSGNKVYSSPFVPDLSQIPQRHHSKSRQPRQQRQQRQHMQQQARQPRGHEQIRMADSSRQHRQSRDARPIKRSVNISRSRSKSRPQGKAKQYRSGSGGNKLQL